MNAEIGNKDHPEYGVVTIPFPIPYGEYNHCMELLDELEVGDVRARDCFISELHDAPEYLDILKGTCVNVDELDYLAKRIESFWGDELDKFEALAAFRQCVDMAELINLTFCSDQTTVITDFSDLEAVGKGHFLTINGGSVDSKAWDNVNGTEVAEQLIDKGECAVTRFGVLFLNNMEFKELYHEGKPFPSYLYKPSPIDVVISPWSKEEPETFLQLPLTSQQYSRYLERGDIVNGQAAIIEINHESCPQVVLEAACKNNPVFDGNLLLQLNALSGDLQALSEKETKKLAAVTLMTKPERISQIRSLVANLDLFEFIPDIKTVEEYGKYYIQESGHFEYDPNLDGFYNYEGYGRERASHETGEFNDMGYVSYHGEMSFEELMMEGEPEQGPNMTGMT